MAGQTIMRDTDGSLKYLLTDHLGSTVAVTNQSGTLTSQQRYLPFGEPRTIPNSPISQTDFTYTGQRKLAPADGMGGIMDHKARFYSPALMRFLQPDSIIPNPANPQAYNRYTYVLNDPVRFNDSTGHCGVQSGEFDGNLDCTIADINSASLQERTAWFEGLRVDMEKQLGEGSGEWFNNIGSILKAFYETGQETSNWIKATDARILVTIQDGYEWALYENKFTGDENLSANKKWKAFFDLQDGSTSFASDKDLISAWGAAEEAGTSYGIDYANDLGYLSDADEQNFLGVGDAYRSALKNLCNKFSWSGTWFDPRYEDEYGNAPVYYVARAMLKPNWIKGDCIPKIQEKNNGKTN